MIPVLLLSAYLIFWAPPPSRRAFGSPPSVSALIRALQRKDSRLNTSEVALWGRLPMYVQSHCQLLRPRLAVETRLDACTRLGRLGAQATNAVPCLIKALDDPDLMVRYRAIYALRAVGPPASGAKGRLLAILRDPAYRNPANRPLMADEMRIGAACTLAAIAPRDPEVVSAFLDLIAHPVTYAAPIDIAREWIARTPEALSVFDSVRKLLPQRETWNLVEGVAQSYPDAKKRLAALLSLAEDPDYGIRCHAVYELGALGPSAADAVPKLMQLFGATEREWEDLPEDTHRARFEAYAAFANETTPQRSLALRYGLAPGVSSWASPSLARSMILALRYGRAPGVRRVPVSPAAPAVTAAAPPAPGPAATAGALSPKYGSRPDVPKPPIDRLTGLGGLHHQVILALGQIGPPARDAIPLLAREYQDPTNSLQFAAAVARVQIDGNFPEVMPALAAGLEQAGPELRAPLLSRIVQLPGFERGVTLLTKALADSDPKIRLEVLKNLAGLGAKAAPALPVFIAALDDPESAIRLQALKNLGALGNSAAPAVPALVKALGDPDKTVRLAAIAGLAALGDNAVPALPALVKALGDPDKTIRWQAVLSLAALGDKAVPALPALRELASDPKIIVRIMASNAVNTIESAARSSPGAQSSRPAP
jgi:HEAT repeat protein